MKSWRRQFERLIKAQASNWTNPIFKYALKQAIEWYRTKEVPSNWEISYDSFLSDASYGVDIYRIRFTYEGKEYEGYIEIKREDGEVWLNVFEKLSGYGIGKRVDV